MKTTAAAAITPPEPGAYPVDIRNNRGDVIGHGWMMPRARQSIDHGRLAVEERRRQFATLSAELRIRGDNKAVVIPSTALLSPRRIMRLYVETYELAGSTFVSSREIARFCARVSDLIYGLMRDWRDEGYPALPGQGWYSKFDAKLEGAWDLALVQKGL